MSEMRRDILSGRWVIVAKTEVLQPSDLFFKKYIRANGFCPFCESNEACTPPEVFAIRRPGLSPNAPGWSVRVVPNSKPRLRIEGGLGRRANGFHDLMNGVGAHEIIIETPRHDQSLHELEVCHIANVIRAWAERITDLYKDERIRYILILKNHGEGAGAHSISHSISQLVALPVTPRNVKNHLQVARRYYAEKERCIYCDVVQQELADCRRLVAENNDFVAFCPFASRFPFEISLFPKFHDRCFTRMVPQYGEALAHIIRDVLEKLDRTLGSPPFNLVLQDSPRLRSSPGYWETIEYDSHWFLEILPHVSRLSGFEWGSGFFYNPVPPELAARCLTG